MLVIKRSGKATGVGVGGVGHKFFDQAQYKLTSCLRCCCCIGLLFSLSSV